ncbi:Uma2 family endonuclease [Actinosynnema sp. CS-041913]|uniref:Uma2 family endonuclease n=1 Tax=Actinosynnema sp. CS-041913 TaxID=3239917 RepID=UPI003D8CB3D5
MLTVAEYASLGEFECGYTELCEGRVVISPNPAVEHNVVLGRLASQLHSQLPGRLIVVHGLDIDLELAPPAGPGFSRRPDLVVLDAAALQRVKGGGGMIRASEVRVVIEVVSPDSHCTDYVVKRAEYADAGIPRYWVVDPVEPISLVDCHLAGEFGYRDASAVTGTFVTTVPCPITLKVDELS